MSVFATLGIPSSHQNDNLPTLTDIEYRRQLEDDKKFAHEYPDLLAAALEKVSEIIDYVSDRADKRTIDQLAEQHKSSIVRSSLASLCGWLNGAGEPPYYNTPFLLMLAEIASDRALTVLEASG